MRASADEVWSRLAGHPNLVSQTDYITYIKRPYDIVWPYEVYFRDRNDWWGPSRTTDCDLYSPETARQVIWVNFGKYEEDWWNHWGEDNDGPMEESD